MQLTFPVPTPDELTRPCADERRAEQIHEYVRIVRSTGGRITSRAVPRHSVALEERATKPPKPEVRRP